MNTLLPNSLPAEKSCLKGQITQTAKQILSYLVSSPADSLGFIWISVSDISVSVSCSHQYDKISLGNRFILIEYALSVDSFAAK